MLCRCTHTHTICLVYVYVDTTICCLGSHIFFCGCVLCEKLLGSGRAHLLCRGYVGRVALSGVRAQMPLYFCLYAFIQRLKMVRVHHCHRATCSASYSGVSTEPR